MKTLSISVDIEADGPVPGLFSMIEVGAVALNNLAGGFSCKLHPLVGASFREENLKAINVKREDTLLYPPASKGMGDFYLWLLSLNQDRLVLWSDNNGFDAMFISWYFENFGLKNPFGFSSRRIGDLWAGLNKKPYETGGWRKFRRTKHTHIALDDARGNAEALHHMLTIYG